MKVWWWPCLLALPAFAGAPEGPVAVLPFKNLNADPNLEWLKAGMAETMVSDIKHGGKLTVVERAQIDKALAEIALHTQGLTEDSTAAKVGKMTGARTVVVGSFQESAKQLRINARFVAVETGEVLGAAKTTGPLSNVFVLQDQIVARLIGPEPSASPRPKVPRKTGTQTLKAYKLYALALTTANDADKVSYLNSAVEADPDFTYAQDELLALKKRLGEYQERSDRALQQGTSDTRAVLHDPALSPSQRGMAGAQQIGKLAAGQRWADVKDLALAMIDANLPAANGLDPTELARMWLFESEHALNQYDLALKSGEDFLQRYPSSNYQASIQARMKQIVNHRLETSDTSEGAQEAEKEVAKIAADRAEKRTALQSRPDALRVQECLWDLGECTAYFNHGLDKRAVDRCTAYANQWEGRAPPDVAKYPAFARWLVAMAHARLGAFPTARAEAEDLIAKHPEVEKLYSVRNIMDTWPRQ